MARPQLRVSVPDDSWLDSLAEVDDVDLVVWDTRTEQPAGRLDLVLLPYALDMEPLARFDTSRIGLVQTQTLGYDGVAEALPVGGTVANAVGVHEESTAELAVALALTALRRLDQTARAQVAQRWDSQWNGSLIDARVLLVGVGGIGAGIARRLEGCVLGSLTRVGSRARDDERGPVRGTDQLPDLLPEADVVFVAVPHTPQTDGLVDDDFLGALPTGALVVNVSRGKVADTDAVVRACTEGRVRYATDVTDPEPLPAGHRLWSTPGVLVNPHTGGKSSAMRPRIERVVRAQIDRLSADEEPLDVVVRT